MQNNQVEFETIADEDLDEAAGGRRRFGRFFVGAPAYGFAQPAAYPAYAAPAVPQVMPTYNPYPTAPAVAPYGVGYNPYGYGMRLGTAI